MGELKPCPFCGKKPFMNIARNVWCTNPMCFMSDGDDRWGFAPIDLWNTRPIEEAQAKEIERLKADLLTRDATWLPEKDAEIEFLRAALKELADESNYVIAVFGPSVGYSQMAITWSDDGSYQHPWEFAQAKLDREPKNE